ncbi:MAG: acyl-CoA thioesterase [Thermoleophilia bacterium]|nr:acyl-CoA thioesterase [Thermoleophilia bacterium]
MADAPRFDPDGREEAWGPFRFAMDTRVDVADTDLGAIVYYGRYAHFVDRAIIAYRRFLGIPPLGPDGHLFVVRALSLQYHGSARFDDVLTVRVRTTNVGRTSHAMDVAVTRVEPGGDVTTLVDGGITQVGVGGYPPSRPSRMPDDVAVRLRGFEGL